ncbi:MAG: AzlD domain-containing protein [Candidatus Promineifilaceae bacterium]|nr:AzlD domain-containing protein [Candidatus Promineifilaceae bacterium]
MTLWLAVIVAGLLTYGQRLSFIALWGRLPMPSGMRRGLRFVPVTVLMALIVPDLFLREGALVISVGNERLLAGLSAALVAWRTRNVLVTIVAGMASLLLLKAV